MSIKTTSSRATMSWRLRTCQRRIEHVYLPRSLIPKNLAGIIHSETVKRADEKLAVIDRLALAAGVQAENVRQNDDHPWQAILKTARDKQCDLIAMASHGRRGASALIDATAHLKHSPWSTSMALDCFRSSLGPMLPLPQTADFGLKAGDHSFSGRSRKFLTSAPAR